MNLTVITALVVVAHLEEGVGRSKVLLQCLECSAIERELEVTILEAHLVMESGAVRDRANLVQVLALTAGGHKLDTDRDLATAAVVDLSLECS